MIKPTIWVPTRSDTNRAVQSKKMVRGLKFFEVSLKLICAFVFAYADCWFSHAAAHIHFDSRFIGQITKTGPL